MFRALILLCAGLLTACKHEPVINIPASRYPKDIAEIMLTRCATAGCHNARSHEAAGGLNLDSWNSLFNGGRNGAAVIPYQHGFSPLFIFVNVHEDLGPMAEPTMPFNQDPLTREQIIRIREWINEGAPASDGQIAYSNISRKYYVANQGCDVVTVFDAESGLAVRYVETGVSAAIESPHMVKVSPDNKYWYVVFIGAQVLQKFDAQTDELVATIDIALSSADDGQWNTLAITADSRTAYLADYAQGKVAVVDLENNQFKYYIGGITSAHGTAISPDGKFLYVTHQEGNEVFKVEIEDPSNVVTVPLYTSTPPVTLKPHEIIFSPDGSKYFLSCMASNEVRVMNTANDSLLKVIQVAPDPREFGISVSKNLLFVTCTGDDITYPGHTGSVSVINLSTLQVVKTVKAGFQSHGIAVDEKKGLVIVSNRNTATGGPPPHHTTSCGGRNGYLTAISLNTLEVISGFRPEVSVDPYAVAIRE